MRDPGNAEPAVACDRISQLREDDMVPPNGFRYLAGYLDEVVQRALLAEIQALMDAAPLYTPSMPRTGRPLSVRMTNCGALGWVTDKESGYRYQDTHPQTGRSWPPMPERLLTLWGDLAGASAKPEACLINHYDANASMGLHRDQDEADFNTPVISISLGDDAWFRIGGLKRRDKSERLLLKSGDIVVLGGDARLAYHGIDRILAGTSDLLPDGGRLNLTLRRVTKIGA